MQQYIFFSIVIIDTMMRGALLLFVTNTRFHVPAWWLLVPVKQMKSDHGLSSEPLQRASAHESLGPVY